MKCKQEVQHYWRKVICYGELELLKMETQAEITHVDKGVVTTFRVLVYRCKDCKQLTTICQ